MLTPYDDKGFKISKMIQVSPVKVLRLLGTGDPDPCQATGSLHVIHDVDK
jgi:hypothetical protein